MVFIKNISAHSAKSSKLFWANNHGLYFFLLQLFFLASNALVGMFESSLILISWRGSVYYYLSTRRIYHLTLKFNNLFPWYIVPFLPEGWIFSLFHGKFPVLYFLNSFTFHLFSSLFQKNKKKIQNDELLNRYWIV